MNSNQMTKLNGSLKKVANMTEFKSQLLRLSEQLLNPLLVIVAATLLRLAPHQPNVAPITAMALFGGAYLSRKSAVVIPLTAMLISDMFLGFHDTIVWVYVSFGLIAGIGMLLRKKIEFRTVFIATMSSSILFYLVTNFGVWAMGTMYSKDFSGLMQSYIMALPFFRNTLLGDIFYSGVFFGGYELLTALMRRNLLASPVSK